jgi:hypothetical protein
MAVRLALDALPQIRANIKDISTTIQIYNEANSAKPASGGEQHVDENFLRDALRS